MKSGVPEDKNFLRDRSRVDGGWRYTFSSVSEIAELQIASQEELDYTFVCIISKKFVKF